MAEFRLAERAETDLVDIGTHTLRTWGAKQCDRYLAALEDCCQTLADNPDMGHACDEIRPGLRRFEQGRHVVFYRRQPYGIRVVRILHDRMLPGGHQFEAE